MQAEREKERCWMHADWANIIRRTIIMVIILPFPHPSLRRRLRHCAGRRLGLPLLHSRSTPCLPTCLFARAHAMQKAHWFSANFVITAPLIVRGTNLFSSAFVLLKAALLHWPNLHKMRPRVWSRSGIQRRAIA